MISTAIAVLPRTVWLLASAIWSAIAGLNLSYALPPAGFEMEGQRIRAPGAILDGRVATCLDSSLLFAACLEQAGLHPVIIFTKGHAFCGVWLRETSLPQLMAEEAEIIRKHAALQELVVFETTLAAKHPAAGFSQAIAAAARRIEEAHDADFVAALDIRRARMQRIRPLGGVAEMAPAAPAMAGLEHGLELPPVIGSLPAEAEPPVPSTPEGRLAHWQRKLLDLTTRNRLLHVPDNAKGVRLLCHDAARLEETLASGRKIAIAALPDLAMGGRDLALYEQQRLEDLQAQVARMALEEKNTLFCAMEKPRLEALLVDLFRSARSDLQEGGANTLFLALGFLKWRKAAEENRVYRAPLILVPVRLERKSALSGVVMTPHEDEARFNLTLLELLRQDFNLDIPGLDAVLPAAAAGNGIDVTAILTMVRRAVRDMAGFEVTEQVMLGSFSFAKYLMWKDMADRAALLAESPVVKHLIERGAERFRSGGEFPHPRELDRKVEPAQLFLPLPADSSQIAAIVAAANGCDFVLDGPPGTGKSQTIANMIAHNLALGRRVLFVAEKMAALNVVYRRLEEKGLGEFCLQLHSNKAAKLDVLKQLERAWDARDSLSAEEWAREAGQLKLMRDRLNEFVALMHRPQPNGMTLHQAIGLAVKNAALRAPRLGWPESVEHDEADMARLRDIVRRLEIGAAQVAGVPREFAALRMMAWSNAWQEEVVEAAAAFAPSLAALRAARDGLLAAVKLPVAADDLPGIAALCALVRAVAATHGQDMRFAFAADFPALAPALARAGLFLQDYRALRARLSVPFADIAAVPVAALELDWQEAAQKFFLLAGGARKKMAQRLGALGGTTGLPSPPEDLPLLRRLQALEKELAALPPLLRDVAGWDGLESDVAGMESMLAQAEALRAAIAACMAAPEALAERSRQVRALAVEGNELLAPNGRIALALEHCVAALAQMRALAERLGGLAGAPDAGLDELGLLATAIIAQPARLKSLVQLAARGGGGARGRPGPACAGAGPGAGRQPVRALRDGLCALVRGAADRCRAAAQILRPGRACERHCELPQARGPARRPRRPLYKGAAMRADPRQERGRPEGWLRHIEAPAAIAEAPQADPPAHDRDGRGFYAPGAVHADEPALHRAISAAGPAALRPGDLRRGLADRALGCDRRHGPRPPGGGGGGSAPDAADQFLRPRRR